MTQKEFNKQLVESRLNLERYAYKLTTNPHDAEDLLQETCLKAMLNKQKYQPYSSFKSWVYTIMKNIFINNYRRSQIQKKYDDHKKNELSFKSQRYNQGAPDTVYMTKEINNRINQLENHYQIPFNMFLEGFKYKEIAEKLDLKIGTVKSRIFLARKNIINSLKN